MALRRWGTSLTVSVPSSPDQLGMIILFSKEIIGPAGVLEHVFTCSDCFTKSCGRLRTASYQGCPPGADRQGPSLSNCKSRTFNNLKFVYLSGLGVRRLMKILHLHLFLFVSFCEKFRSWSHFSPGKRQRHVFSGRLPLVFRIHDWVLQHEGCVREGVHAMICEGHSLLTFLLFCSAPPQIQIPLAATVAVRCQSSSHFPQDTSSLTAEDLV